MPLIWPCPNSAELRRLGRCRLTQVTAQGVCIAVAKGLAE